MVKENAMLKAMQYAQFSQNIYTIFDSAFRLMYNIVISLRYELQ